MPLYFSCDIQQASGVYRNNTHIRLAHTNRKSYIKPNIIKAIYIGHKLHDSYSQLASKEGN